MKKTGFYIIKDQFFEDMSDPYLKGNKSERRPHYYCFKDTKENIYWMIPLSSKIDKYRKLELYKMVEILKELRIMKTVRKRKPLQKMQRWIQNGGIEMLSVLAVCGAAYFACMVAMTMHGMKN